jgi:hypothetical protein
MAVNLPDSNKVPGDSNHTSDTNLIIEAINTLQSQVDNIPAGATGAKGDTGEAGAAGTPATVTVGSTTTSAAGGNAAVTNSGTASDAIFDFTIPRGSEGPKGDAGDAGAQGPKGDPGDNAAISVGTVTTGVPESNVTVTNSGTTTNAVLNFSIPRGATGEAANLGDNAGEDLGTAAAGVSTSASRQDHVHNMPSAADVGADASGSAAAAQTAAQSYADGLASNYDAAGSAAAVASDLSDHELATTTVHGITNTANLVYTDDSRLSDERTPSDDSVTSAKIVNGAIVDADVNAAAAIAPSKIDGTAVVDSDSRLTDARTPTAHATSHESGGSDELTLAQSQVTNLTSDLSAKAPLASPTFTGTPSAPTAANGTSTTQLATTAFVDAAVPQYTASAPASPFTGLVWVDSDDTA